MSQPAMSGVPSQSEFLEALNSEFESDFDVLMTHRLVEDLNFDSLDMVNLFILIEEFAACEIKEPFEFAELSTVAESYEYLERMAKQHGA